MKVAIFIIFIKKFLKILKYPLLRLKKAGRFEKLLGFGRIHSIVTLGSLSLPSATTPHPSCFSKS